MTIYKLYRQQLGATSQHEYSNIRYSPSTRVANYSDSTALLPVAATVGPIRYFIIPFVDVCLCLVYVLNLWNNVKNVRLKSIVIDGS